MGVAGRPLVELEEFSQVGEREMPLDILLPIDDARTQGLFVGLTLENLLLDSSNLDNDRKGKLPNSLRDSWYASTSKVDGIQ